MTSALPFALRVQSPDQITRGRIESREERYSGVARLSHTALLLEWSGVREDTDVKGGSVTSRIEPLAVARLAIPAGSIMDASLRKQWWRLFLRIRVNDVSRLAGFPGAAATECRLRISREDHSRAREFLADLRLLMADSELRSAEELPIASEAHASRPIADAGFHTPQEGS